MHAAHGLAPLHRQGTGRQRDGERRARTPRKPRGSLALIDDDRLAVTGVGKSADVGRKVAATFNSTGTRAYTLAFRGKDEFVVVSQNPDPATKGERLWVDGLQEGHVHDLAVPGVRSAEGRPLLHPQAYYTLNYVPAK